MSLLFLLLFSMASAKENALDRLLSLPSSPNISYAGYDKSSEVKKITVNAQQEQGHIKLQWAIPSDTHLYKDKIQVKLVDSSDARVGRIIYPPAVDNPVFGEVYDQALMLDVPITGFVAKEAKLIVQYQGCTQDYCLLPESKTIAVDGGVVSTMSAPGHNWWMLFAYLGIGLLLAMTPCVLPMLPIITSIVVGRNNSRAKGFSLALAYVLGMAIAYAAIGILITKIGLSFQLFFQQPFVIITLMALFVLLALSMFGLLTIQLPQRLSAKIYGTQNKGTRSK
ncbi:MAG: protein-disulfide reductase DsbD domain-containing protein [Francisellaceae bacterium]